MARKFEFTKPDIIIQKHPNLLRSTDFVTPATLDNRDRMLETENQGNKPQCAAYTGTSWLESIEWPRTGKPVNYDPEALYAKAKEIDGHPDRDGTTLEAIMKGMIQLGWTKKTEDDIRFIDTIPELQRAIHRYGTCLIACEIHEQWGLQVGDLMEKVVGKSLGGHAVTCCGFDRVGVFVQNSWGYLWGNLGFCKIKWKCFEQEFAEGSYYANALDGMEG